MKVFFEGALIAFVFLLFICAMFIPVFLSVDTGCSWWLLLYFILIPCFGGWFNCIYRKWID